MLGRLKNQLTNQIIITYKKTNREGVEYEKNSINNAKFFINKLRRINELANRIS